MKFNLNKVKNLFGKKSNPSCQNPHLDRVGRKIWNDQFLNLIQSKKHWKLAFAALFLVNFILSLIVFKLSTQSTIKPFVVELNKGVPIGILPTSQNLPDIDKLIQFAVTQFIINARTVLNDSDAEKLLLNKTYAFSAENTLGSLRDYYNAHNPFEKAGSCSVSINILNTLKIGAKTWQITWDEVERSLSGDAITNQSRFLATVTVEQHEPNANYLNDNPFGIYITHVSWAKI